MVFSRSMSQGAKIVAPELLGDAHTVEEMKDIDQIEESAPEPTKRKPKAKPAKAEVKEEEGEEVKVRRAPDIATGEAEVVLIDGGTIPEAAALGEEPKEEEEEEEVVDSQDVSEAQTQAKKDVAAEAAKKTFPRQKIEKRDEELKITRAPSSVSTIAEMYKACFDDFAAQPAEVMKLLNIKANSDIIETPWDCYVTVAKRMSKAPSKEVES